MLDLCPCRTRLRQSDDDLQRHLRTADQRAQLVELGETGTRTVPPVREARYERQRELPSCATDLDRDASAHRPRPADAVRHPIVHTLVREGLTGEHQFDDLERLPQPGRPHRPGLVAEAEPSQFVGH